MSNTKKIKAGLVLQEPSEFVGQAGTLFYNPDTGSMYLSDGQTPGGISLGQGGSGGGFSGNYNDLTNKPNLQAYANTTYVDNKSTWGNITGKPSFATVATSGNYNDLSNKPTIPSLSGYATESYVSSALSSKVDSTSLALVATSGNYNDLEYRPTISTVGHTGNYSDLTNKPSIPSVVGLASESFVTSQGYITSSSLSTTLSDYATKTYVGAQNFVTTTSLLAYNYLTASQLNSRNYITLSDVPTIPTNISELTNDSGFITSEDVPFVPTSLSDLGITAGSDGQVLTLDSSLTPVWATPSSGGGSDTGNITFSDTTLTSSNGNVKIHFTPTASPAVEFNFTSSGEFIASSIKTGSVRGTASQTAFYNVDDVGMLIDSLNSPLTIDIGDMTTWDFVRFKYGAGSATGNDGDVEIMSPPMGSPSVSSSISISPQGGQNGSFTFGGDGTLTVPGYITKGDNLTLNSLGIESGNVAAVVADGENGRVFIRTDDGITLKTWEFDINGNLKLPAGGDIVDSTGTSVLGGGSGSTDRLVNSSYSFILDEHGVITATNGTIGPTQAGEFGFGADTGADAVIKANGGFSTWTFKSDNTLQLPAGGDIVDSTGTSVLGGGSIDTGNITFSGDSIGSTNNSVNITGSNYTQIECTDNGSYTNQIWVEQAGAYIYLDGTQWSFNTPTVAGAGSNSFNMPNGVKQRSGDFVSCDSNMDTVIYTSSEQYIHTLKLLLCIEGVEDGQSELDTQSCEMIVAKSFRNNTVSGSAYGLVYTSTNPLVTLTTRWNAIDERIEVLCRPTSAMNGVSVHVTCTELSTSQI